MKKISTGEIFINKYNENDIPYIERNRKNKKKRQRSPLSYIYKKKERKKKSQVKIYDLFYIITILSQKTIRKSRRREREKEKKK